MEITRLFIRNPAITAALISLVLLLGIVSVQQLPTQLFPSIDRPVLAVQVSWRAASPREIESEIVEPIERELRGISGMTRLRSFSNAGGAYINMSMSLAPTWIKPLPRFPVAYNAYVGCPLTPSVLRFYVMEEEILAKLSYFFSYNARLIRQFHRASCMNMYKRILLASLRISTALAVLT